MGRSSRELITYWDRQAPTYDARMTGLERRFFADTRAWICSRAEGSTLELAIGTGANLAHYPAGVELTGVDWSPASLDVARATADRLGRRVTLQTADAAALPYPDGSYDTVVATFALCCVPDVRAVLAEALRVLRPGGRLLLADHVRSTSWPLRAAQHLVDLVTAPLHGEHYTRRPSDTLLGLGVTPDERERLSMGVIERLSARR